MLARDTSDLGLSSVRLAVSTTCALPQSVARIFSNASVSARAGVGHHRIGIVSLNSDEPQARWDSVGRPLADCEVRIIAPDEDGCGEVEISGPGMFDAYAAPWVPREKVLHDGCFGPATSAGWMRKVIFSWPGAKSA